jgi:hypothetical protein
MPTEKCTAVITRFLNLLGFQLTDATGVPGASDVLLVAYRHPLDTDFLRLASESFADWKAPEAEAEFRHL